VSRHTVELLQPPGSAPFLITLVSCNCVVVLHLPLSPTSKELTRPWKQRRRQLPSVLVDLGLFAKLLSYSTSPASQDAIPLRMRAHCWPTYAGEAVHHLDEMRLQRRLSADWNLFPRRRVALPLVPDRCGQRETVCLNTSIWKLFSQHSLLYSALCVIFPINPPPLRNSIHRACCGSGSSHRFGRVGHRFVVWYSFYGRRWDRGWEQGDGVVVVDSAVEGC